MHRYGIAASAPLIDLLEYLCEVNADDRPKSMKEVFMHAFFDTINGNMRLGKVTNLIRRQLNEVNTQRTVNGTVLLLYVRYW